MQHEMLRKKKQLSTEESYEILKNGEFGILATVDEGAQPYGTPISYVLLNDYIYCHCAIKGHKLENIKYNDKVSFTVVGDTSPVFENSGNFSAYFESTIVFGKAIIVEEPQEKVDSLKALCEKYLPDHMDRFQEAIDRSLKATCVFKIEIKKITGKAKKR